MSTNKINIPFDIEDQLLWDILTTAIEGGSDYWIASYLFVDRNSDQSVVKVEIADYEGEKFIADKNTILDGMKIMIASEKVHFNKYVIDAVLEEDYDAESADIMLQYGLFKELVYG
jgi:hypothetical protein